MRISRRAALGGAAAMAASAAFGVRRASAAEFTYKYANNLPDSHPLNVRANEAAEKIKAETGGRFELQVFPANQLGSDTDMLGQLRLGALEFLTMSGLILSTLVPAASINGMGFAFADYPTVWKAMDGELGAYVRGQIAKAGLVAFDTVWDNGFRQITTSTKPVNTPDDLKGLKIRVPVSPLWTSLFKTFGSAPASINFAETYSALQTKVVDAQENPLAVISTAKLYEVQKYCSMTGHMWDGFWFLANKSSFEALPDDIRAVVVRRLNAAAAAEREDVAKLNSGLQTELAAKGMVFNRADPAPFREVLRQSGFYAQWKQKYGEEAFSILEKSVGKLA
jgi:TRAP-type transport system periplasmic protein